MLKPLTLAGVVLASMAASSCVDIVALDTERYMEREEKRFTVSGRPELTLSTFDGAIEVRSSDTSQVLIEIEKRGPTREAVEALVVESSQEGSRIKLEVKQPRKEHFSGFGFHMSASARLIGNS